MKIFGVDTQTRPAIIAEIGVNHEGSLDKALELLALAAQSGADAVKFQSYTAERFISSDDAERQARVRRFGLDEASHLALKDAAVNQGVAFCSSAISEDWVPFLAEHCAAIKIASGDIDFEPVIRDAAATGLPVILSTGTATLEEVRAAIGWAVDEMGEDGASDCLAVLHCVSAYPTPLEQANLRAIGTLKNEFPELTIGYSNHVIGPEAPIAAATLGAEIVEVHFTDQKHGRDFRDHELSCDPSDLAYICEVLPKVFAGLGSGDKSPQSCEEGTGPAIRKGLVAARDLPADHILGKDDMMFARPATEFPASQHASLVGRALTRALRAGQVLKREDVA